MLMDAILAAIVPGVIAALALAVTHFVLWSVRWFWTPPGRLAAYTIGVAGIWAAFGGWATQTGDWGAWLALGVIIALIGGLVVLSWAVHYVRGLAEQADPALQPGGRRS